MNCYQYFLGDNVFFVEARNEESADKWTHSHISPDARRGTLNFTRAKADATAYPVYDSIEVKGKEFYIDFSGYLTIEAADEDEAERKFWQFVDSFAHRTDIYNDVWDIEGITLRKDNIEPLFADILQFPLDKS